jgi:hypothetical protein
MRRCRSWSRGRRSRTIQFFFPLEPSLMCAVADKLFVVDDWKMELGGVHFRPRSSQKDRRNSLQRHGATAVIED